MKSTAIWS